MQTGSTGNELNPFNFTKDFDEPKPNILSNTSSSPSLPLMVLQPLQVVHISPSP
jgi:hypothetical protein